MALTDSTAAVGRRYDVCMLIRQAGISDAAAIAAVHVRSWQVAYRGLVPQEFLDRMSAAERRPAWERQLAESSWPRRGILVAEVDGHITGFAAAEPTRDQDEDPATVAEIAAIYLEPEVWGTGIGRRLMEATLQNLAQAEYEQVTLWVLDTNTRACRFYEATGWRPDGAAKRDTTRGFPLVQIRYRHMGGDSNSSSRRRT